MSDKSNNNNKNKNNKQKPKRDFKKNPITELERRRIKFKKEQALKRLEQTKLETGIVGGVGTVMKFTSQILFITIFYFDDSSLRSNS